MSAAAPYARNLGVSPKRQKDNPRQGRPFVVNGFFIVSSSFQFGSHGLDRLVYQAGAEA